MSTVGGRKHPLFCRYLPFFRDCTDLPDCNPETKLLLYLPVGIIIMYTETIMTEFYAGQFDIAVIGAGHAGIEAALAAARLGLSTVCFTINLDAVGNMPCNPAIGGTGKGQIGRAHV